MKLIAVTAAAFALAAVGFAQNPPASQADMDRFEKAHEGIFGQQPDKAAETSRLTQSVAKATPRTAGAQQKIAHRNFIDDLLFGRMDRDKVPHAPLSSDEEFVRRVYLDAIGLLPTPDQVRTFLADKDPNKRDKLIDSLIGTDEFADHWGWYWGDLMRTNQDFFHFYNRQWLKADRPYNEVFADLMTAQAKEAHMIPMSGFYHAANYNAARAMSPTDPDNYYLVNRLDFLDEVSIDVSRVFLGLNTDCISCHNGKGHLTAINHYLTSKTRDDFQKEAAFFGNMRMTLGWSDRILNVADENTIYDESAPGYNTKDDGPYYTPAENRFPRPARVQEPAFLLTGEKPAPGESPRKALGRILPKHIQFSRAAVNVVWSRLMVLGFVEPYDSFDLDRLDPKNPPPSPWTIQPTNPELLEAMAKDFQAKGYSIQTLMKTIMKSSAYQLSTHFDGEWKESYTPYYARRYSRVLSGPEAADAIATATGRPFSFTMRGENVTRVQQLGEPNQVMRGGPGSTRTDGLMVSAVMQSFFQSKRQTPATLGNTATSVQAMLMMVSPTVVNRVAAEKDSRLAKLLASPKTDNEILDEMWLASLSRHPLKGELDAATHILAKDRRTGYEDIQWALMNSPEFLVNH